MNERSTDFEWLQQFARAGNQTAFRELVQRHLDLVFATALHKTRDPGGAEEIAQNVFGVLARKAWQFAPDDSLPAWLHRTTLLECKAWLRGEIRRRHREQAAVELGTTMKTSDDASAAQALVPLLDEALLSLREKERTVLLLRFYEKHSLREVGSALGVSEDTAQKRVQTALEKIAEFFQRRGYKTATVAAAAGALQATSTTTSAAMVTLVTQAALPVAPTAMVGLTAYLARLATLTKVQTAAICVAATLVPVLWQWQAQRETQAALAQVQDRLAGGRVELNQLQVDLARTRESLATAQADWQTGSASAAEQADQDRRFEAWKQRLRGQLLASNYQWPDDSPFIRVPKKILSLLAVRRAVEYPGLVKPEASELLGMTPQERQQVEAALHTYYAAADQLMEASRYETNRGNFVHISSDAIDSHVFGIPALGDGMKQLGDALKASLQSDLGSQRWDLVQEELRNSGTDTLRQSLNLDTNERGQELAVWIQDHEGKLVAGFSFAQQEGFSFGLGGLLLSSFLPGQEVPKTNIEGGGHYMELEQLPATLSRPALAWIQQQALARQQTKGDQ